MEFEGSQTGSAIPRAAIAGAGRNSPPPIVHLHGNQHIKRAGEARSRLRASGAGKGQQAAPTTLGRCSGGALRPSNERQNKAPSMRGLL